LHTLGSAGLREPERLLLAEDLWEDPSAELSRAPFPLSRSHEAGFLENPSQQRLQPAWRPIMGWRGVPYPSLMFILRV
jgi:hypothetical protein